VRFEPLSALISDDKGLADIDIIIDKSREYLNSGAPLILEHGYDQAGDVARLFSSYGYQNVMTIKDLSGKNRVSIGYFQ
jgi:release factor glutamine methyltransferase